jgi:hypothetical protein
MVAIDAVADVVTGARCWGIELDPRYRVLATTIEPDPLRVPGTAGEHQLLCFPVSVLLVAVTRPILEQGEQRTALLTFELDQLMAVSERFAGATIEGRPFGLPEPRPGTWGPRYSLEGRTSAPDGTGRTLTLDLSTEDGARLRLFARFDELELRDASGALVMGTSELLNGSPVATPDTAHRAAAGEPADGEGPNGRPPRDEDPLRF